MRINKYIGKAAGICLLAWAALSCEEEFPVPESSEVAADFSITFSDGDFAPSVVVFESTSLLKEGITEVSYVWNFGDGTSGSGSSVTHSYDMPGDYRVSMVASTGADLDAIEKVLTVRDPNALQVDILFMDAGTMAIENLNGTSFEVDGFGTGLAYDETSETLYYTDADNGTLISSAVDGSAMTVVATGLDDPRDLALDIEAGMAYVADRGLQAILEVNLSDGTVSTLYDVASDGLGELPVGIDFYDGNIYVTCVEIDAEAVWKGNVDGSGITRILDYSGAGYGYGIAVDSVNKKIYFDNTDNSEILMANLDGTGVQQVIATSNRVYGLAVDNTNQKLYWTERNTGNVYMSDLDGSNRVTIGSGYTDPRGLVFIP
ncbi:PKD domain-containing protein [Reichenbachiella ulvae]|uniref:PKD domain-containing protein n=1 Tax=Reichenbachiella ulvae TaxID=2980104 RepID=A0ABT3CNL2_9BACT|nr:PKD domain-containing protein [Reichenbachiella ulvae]MCV9385300.1 PKD domain-containing protein [Reichenbachiella ulvae]